jgi:hypothetical protein
MGGFYFHDLQLTHTENKKQQVGQVQRQQTGKNCKNIPWHEGTAFFGTSPRNNDEATFQQKPAKEH